MTDGTTSNFEMAIDENTQMKLRSVSGSMKDANRPESQKNSLGSSGADQPIIANNDGSDQIEE